MAPASASANHSVLTSSLVQRHPISDRSMASLGRPDTGSDVPAVLIFNYNSCVFNICRHVCEFSSALSQGGVRPASHCPVFVQGKAGIIVYCIECVCPLCFPPLTLNGFKTRGIILSFPLLFALLIQRPCLLDNAKQTMCALVTGKAGWVECWTEQWECIKQKKEYIYL